MHVADRERLDGRGACRSTGIAMSQRSLSGLTLLLVLTAVLPSAAQQTTSGPRSDSSGVCPSVSGLVFQLFRGDTALRRGRDSVSLARREVIDTTWTFHVAERQWNQQRLAAVVGAGLYGDAAVRGTTSAPDAARTWSACVGARIDLGNVNLMLRGARGSVHLRADLRPLLHLERTADSTSQPE
jgi:hypothetical protein